MNLSPTKYALIVFATVRIRIHLSPEIAGRIDATSKSGKWGVNKVSDSQEVQRRKQFIEDTIGPLVARLRVLATSYREMVTNFLIMLQSHSDPSLHFLPSNLNFNSHYQIRQVGLNDTLLA
ncbi:unnamed protein product [Schistocephalus solidus]|uniref:DUF632 domain-containing protein n=1 Tax=Schistocephalus solidus TaxID=70667 RepID=A0A183SZ71_SCHSO|nr:unnamed protein product [Schistocephalus solidus]